MPRAMASKRIAAALEAAGASPKDDREKLAIDLFVSSGFESNPYAMFLLRMTVLEVLAERSPIDPAGLDAIEEWIGALEDFADKGLSDDPARSLGAGLQNLRRRSISKSVEGLVRAEAGADAAARVSKLYQLRGRMLHDGVIPDGALLHAELNDLTGIVRKVLHNRIGV